MILNKGKKIVAVCATALPLLVISTLFFAANNPLSRSKASTYTTTLNNNNSPVLSNGEGTMTDDKNVTWEYHNASDLVNGHVSIGHQGYFGISASSDWGYSTIENITATFTKGENGELWLLTSLDGTEWSEYGKLTSGTPVTLVNAWNYIRFYCWDSSNELANITSVVVNYDCEGVGPYEDTDFAKIENLRKNDYLEPSVETQIVSPRGNSTEALRLTSTNGRTGNRHETIFNIPEVKLEKIRFSKLEFDYYYREKRDPNKDPGYPRTRMAKPSGIYSTERTLDGKKDFTVEDIGNGWWHIECYISSMVSPADTPAASSNIGGIVLYDDAIYTHDVEEGVKVGFIIVDNLRITNYSTSAAISNSWTKVTIGATDKDRYFIRENTCGFKHSATHVCSDTTKARLYYEVKYGVNLCYIEGLEEGEIVVTITYVLGHEHKTVQVETVTLTVGY